MPPGSSNDARPFSSFAAALPRICDLRGTKKLLSVLKRIGIVQEGIAAAAVAGIIIFSVYSVHRANQWSRKATSALPAPYTVPELDFPMEDLEEPLETDTCELLERGKTRQLSVYDADYLDLFFD